MECILSLTMAQMFTYDKTIKNYSHRSSEKVGLKRRISFPFFVFSDDETLRTSL